MKSFTAECWHGDRGALVAIFKPYVTEPSWFKCDEDMETSSVQPNLLAPLGDLWRNLKKEQANLSFPQSELEAIFKSLIDDTWRLTAAEILDWKKRWGNVSVVLAGTYNRLRRRRHVHDGSKNCSKRTRFPLLDLLPHLLQ